jgi:hypothetical protein
MKRRTFAKIFSVLVMGLLAGKAHADSYDAVFSVSSVGAEGDDGLTFPSPVITLNVPYGKGYVILNASDLPTDTYDYSYSSSPSGNNSYDVVFTIDDLTDDEASHGGGLVTPEAIDGRGTLTFDAVTPAPTATPEPGTLALLGTGLLCAAGVVRRRLSGW